MSQPWVIVVMQCFRKMSHWTRFVWGLHEEPLIGGMLRGNRNEPELYETIDMRVISMTECLILPTPKVTKTRQSYETQTTERMNGDASKIEKSKSDKRKIIQEVN